MKGKKWILAKQFSGVPTDENLKLVEYDLPDEMQPGGMLMNPKYCTHMLLRLFFIFNSNFSRSSTSSGLFIRGSIYEVRFAKKCFI